MLVKKICNSAIETKMLGEKLGSIVEENMVITLAGDLGAGKTTFTQGIAKGLGIKKTVSSPTFTILKVYRGRMPLYHIDAYRLEGGYQDLGFDELMEDQGLTVIEWPDFMREDITDERLEIEVYIHDHDVREFIFKPYGKVYEKLLEELV